MTTANKVTIGRILLVPFFIAEVIYYTRTGLEVFRWMAIGCFGIAAASDGLDGFIARHFNQRSELGALLDPLADKILVLSGIILLSVHNEPYLPALPIWLTVTVLSREVLLVIGLGVFHVVIGKIAVAPHLLGKSATVLQMAAILWALFKLNAQGLYAICIAAAVLTGVSGVIYVLDGMRHLSKHPASSPTKTRE